MRLRTFWSRETYKTFDVGEEVTATSPRCVLPSGEVHVVTECVAPFFAGEESIVFVEGRPTGFSAEYLKSVNGPNPTHPEDISDAVLAHDALRRAAEAVQETIREPCERAQHDLAAVAERALAFIHAHDLHDDFASYLARQHTAPAAPLP